MPLSLLYEWIAFQRLEPFGFDVEDARWKLSEYRAYHRNGMLMAGLINIWTKKGARKFKAKDFIPDSVKPDLPPPSRKPAMSPSSVYRMLKTGLRLARVTKPDAND